jgi:omega-6 fatty acid desaturase (delta-12 desaturase)
MPAPTPTPQSPAEPNWRAAITPYVAPDMRRALLQLATTALPFILIMAGMLVALHYGILAALLLFPVAAMLLVRLFMFQHDCGHGSFFKARWANDLLGWVLGVLTLTPYLAWRGEHAIHHAGAGNLDRRGVGDITTLTVPEYLALSRRRRCAYRFYRNPLVLFGLGPVWLFLITNRIPSGSPRRNWREWLSVLGTNLAIAALLASLMLVTDPLTVLLSWLPVMLLAATIGVWLFYVQHQFEPMYWEPKSSWDFRAAALKGASFYDLPLVLHWCTGNIGFHHIHHLCSRIPNYRLRECFEANAQFQDAPRLTLRSSLGCIRLALWDAEQRSMISFRKLRARAKTAALRRNAAAAMAFPVAAYALVPAHDPQRRDHPQDD